MTTPATPPTNPPAPIPTKPVPPPAPVQPPAPPIDPGAQLKRIADALEAQNAILTAWSKADATPQKIAQLVTAMAVVKPTTENTLLALQNRKS